MPGYRGHLVGGLATFFVIHLLTRATSFDSFTSLKFSVAALICTLIGALFPDIDTISIGQRILYITLAVTAVGAIFFHNWKLLGLVGLFCAIPLILHHRGIMHSIWFLSTVPLLVFLGISQVVPWHISFSFALYGYFLAGALSHLILDFGVVNVVRQLLGKK